MMHIPLMLTVFHGQHVSPVVVKISVKRGLFHQVLFPDNADMIYRFAQKSVKKMDFVTFILYR